MIADAIESVLGQNYQNFEHIIVDGGSNDGTLEILAGYPHLQVISEPDRGLYDAINKGVFRAGGEIIGLLNTDDRYAPNMFSQVLACFLKYPNAWAVCGGSSFFRYHGQDEQSFRYLRPITPYTLLERLTTGIPAINSWFFRKAVFQKVGHFDLAYQIAADRDLLLRFACAELLLVPIEKDVIRYGSHSGSLTNDVWKPTILDENLRLAAQYGDRYDIPLSVRRACQKWERIYTLEIIGHFLRRKDYSSGLNYYRHVARRHWWWPIYFAIAFPLTAAKYIARK